MKDPLCDVDSQYANMVFHWTRLLWLNGFTGLEIILAHCSRSAQGAGPFHYDPVAESWIGIGVVPGFWGVVLLLQGPHVRHVDSRWRITLIHILPFVMATCKTRNQ